MKATLGPAGSATPGPARPAAPGSGLLGFELEVARRTVRSGPLLAAGACAVFAGVYAVGGPTSFAMPCLVAAVALAIIAIAPISSVHLHLYASVVIGMALLTVQPLLLGRVDTGVIVCFLVPALATMIVGARTLAAIVAVVTAAVIVIGSWTPRRS